MTKDEIRAAAKERRRALCREDVIKKSQDIFDRLMPLLDTAKTVMCYMSAFNEPRTDRVIAELIKNGVRVAVPVTDTDTKTITPALYTGELKRGAYGIYEPEDRIAIDPNNIDIAVIPGIAFDRRGTRIGFGAGYYDRFLAGFVGKKIGICYELQLYDEIPHDEHDIAMDTIVTERKVYDI
ncbi:MAG: 5-formyltetrahydrofolate cyclo-ligase [Clostridia bacterium]|nr:5-formyltetrahydrofolate cyclo-ligase [Clostridia bacterium]